MLLLIFSVIKNDIFISDISPVNFEIMISWAWGRFGNSEVHGSCQFTWQLAWDDKLVDTHGELTQQTWQ